MNTGINTITTLPHCSAGFSQVACKSVQRRTVFVVNYTMTLHRANTALLCTIGLPIKSARKTRV